MKKLLYTSLIMITIASLFVSCDCSCKDDTTVVSSATTTTVDPTEKFTFDDYVSGDIRVIYDGYGYSWSKSPWDDGDLKDLLYDTSEYDDYSVSDDDGYESENSSYF